MARFTIRIGDKDLELIDERAELEGVSRSEAARRSFREWANSPTLDAQISDLKESMNSFSVVFSLVVGHVAKSMSEEEVEQLVDFMRERDDSFAESLVRGFEERKLLSGDSE